MSTSHTGFTPWASGLAVAVLCCALTAAASYTFTRAMIEIHPVLALAVTMVYVVGATPTVWRWRLRPVRRWVAYGLAAGVILGWLALLPMMSSATTIS